MRLNSVRGRLLLLVSTLLVTLIGANLLLTYFLQKREPQEIAQAEQYDRLRVIQQVGQAMLDTRHRQSLLNVAVLVNDEALRLREEAQLRALERLLEQRLQALEKFDSVTARRIREERELSLIPMHRSINAIVSQQSESIALARRTMGHLDTIQMLLREAGERESQAAAELTARQMGDARRASSSMLSRNWACMSLAATVLVLRSILNPLRKTSQALRQINDGQVLVDLPPITDDEFGEIAQALRQFRDQAEHLRELAYTDSLTGLGNRARMDHALHLAVTASRERNEGLALLSIDLDNFGAVNDGLGYTAGDAYLREAGARLARFAPDDALVCRYSGDKFTVLVEMTSGDEPEHQLQQLRHQAELILRGMSESYAFRSHLLPMSVSIGVALFPQHASSAAELVSGADAAMYLVKQDGRHGLRFADRSLSTGARQDLEMVADLRRGIAQSEFLPYYQPIVDTLTGQVPGAEALLRWQHPQRGLVTADRFIVAAEASGQIHELGELCLRAVCAQLVQWQHDGDAGFWVSANLSTRQIEQGDLVRQLEKLLLRPGFRPRSLLLEITESAALDRIEHARETLDQVRELGFQIGMDDFGTGYSSMVYLQRFPVDKIKIDRLFVQRMDSSREALAIVSAVIAIARSLQLQVVAEGVETEAQSRQLREMGCHLQQGFHFARALPAVEFARWRQDYERRNRVAVTA